MATQPNAPFDVVATYKRLLSEDADLTMPVAAIEALILALATTPATTVSETLDLVSKLTATLKQGIPNPISLSAGTDLFQQYLITSLQRPSARSGSATAGMGGGVSSSSNSADGDFEHVRAHLIQNGKLFVARAKAARTTIAGFGRHFIRDGATVLTSGGSRVVGALLQSAAGGDTPTITTTTAASSSSLPSSAPSSPSRSPSPPSSPTRNSGTSSVRFRVIYVVSPDDASARESAAHIAALRARDVPVAVVPPTAVAASLERVTACFVGAEGVVENGGVVSRMGTFQLGVLARAAGKPLYVVAESHKFVRLYPLGQRDLGLRQRVLEFRTARGRVGDGDEDEDVEGETKREEDASMGDEGFAEEEETRETDDAGGAKAAAATAGLLARMDDAVDYTPPNLISGIITESGVLLPSAVSEELIKIWF